MEMICTSICNDIEDEKKNYKQKRRYDALLS